MAISATIQSISARYDGSDNKNRIIIKILFSTGEEKTQELPATMTKDEIIAIVREWIALRENESIDLATLGIGVNTVITKTTMI